MNTIKTLKKPTKMTTTIRFDSRLRKQVQSFAQSHGIDFSTLVTLSLKTTLQNGIHLNPLISDERYAVYE
jgi:antitoxin component of RelBE/YafQ-DinJ toxin-antitoxin module